MQASPMPVRMPRRITIVSASVGAGHDGAATELARRLEAQGFAVDRHDFLDLLPAALGRALRRAYAVQLRVAPDSWGRLLAALERHPSLAAAAAGCTRLAARRISRTLQPGTEAVVSTYPLASQALGGLRRRGLLEVPVITYLTDLSVHPLWVADGVDAHLALHPVAAEQAERLGAAGVQVAVPAVPPAFHAAASALERRAARLGFGLPHEDEPLALVVAGSWGVGDVAETAREIAASGLATPVVVCGLNTALREDVRSGIALGWVDDMPALMRACDVVVQNAGGLSSLEALASGLPVISYRCLPGHGSTNAAALDQAGWAPWVRCPEELREALTVSLAAGATVVGSSSAQEGTDPADFIAALAGSQVFTPLQELAAAGGF
jgi:UDP-N-acetylglucosamine:LPS N-acetylglucosamine transferase